MSKKDKWQTELTEGLACPIPASMAPIFLRGGNGSWSLSVENNANRFLFQKANLLIHNGRGYSTAPA